MKKINILYIILSIITVFSFIACSDSDDNLSGDANVELAFKVKKTIVDENGAPLEYVFNSSIGQDTITIKIAPHMDEKEFLSSATPVFYLSKGATVSPDPSLPQDFTQEGGVKYTVTSEDGKNVHEYVVTWGASDLLPFGSGFTYAEIGTVKSFAELGYPGEVGNFDFADSKQYGDLIMYHAYCGNSIVLLSRAYIDENPKSPYTVKVVNKSTLAESGTLNLGSINISNLKMITSDYKGRCVGAVTNGNETEIFYWLQPGDAPTSVGKININMASTSDGSSNFQVSGDITGNAWITAMAPRSAKGEHYRVQVTGGKLASTHSVVTTGFASDDSSAFQMISALDDSDKPSYVVGDTDGAAATANSIRCYVNSPSGLTTATMPGLWQSTLQAWWVGTGFSTARSGGRAPVVSALPINGKTYVVVTSGTGWWHSAAVLHTDLKTLAHANLNIAHSVNRGWSYGSWVDWYWDEENSEAHLAIWLGRLGLYTYKLTCYE